MSDLFTAATQAISSRSLWGIPLALSTGFVTSAGPCLAPRLMTVSSLSGGSARSASVTTAIFIAGLTFAYSSFAFAGAVLWHALNASGTLYAVMASVLTIAGVARLLKSKCCSENDRQTQATSGGAFVLGAFSALLVSPCCAPLIFAALAYGSSSGSVGYTAAILASFALGHALPLTFAGAMLFTVRRFLGGRYAQQAVSVCGSGLMIALGGYYAILA